MSRTGLHSVFLVVTGLVYRTEGPRRLSLEVYQSVARRQQRPVPGGSRPAVIAIHGGSWNGGSMTSFRYDARNMVVRLAQSELVVFAIDYRLARPGSPSWPAVIDDLERPSAGCAGMRCEFGVDPGRIAVLGQSSGGHLATLLATLADRKRSRRRLVAGAGGR